MFENHLQFPNLLKKSNGKLIISGPFVSMVFGSLFLGLVLALPSGIPAMFDGLPWTGKAETLALSVIIPFLLFLGHRFLSSRLSIFYLCALLLLKAILFFGSPSGGWLVKVHPNLPQDISAGIYPFKTVEGSGWVNTYATIWNEKASGILNGSWKEKLDFPLDWALMHINGCVASLGYECFKKLNPIIEIDGALIIPEGKKFSLIAEGAEGGTLLATNKNGESVVILPAKNRKEATQLQYQFLQAGVWSVSGNLHYAGKDWSLVPTLMEASGEISADIGREVLWQNIEDLSNSQENIWLYKALSFIVDGGIIIFLLVWATLIVLSLADREILNLPLTLSSITLFIFPAIFAPVYAGLLKALGSSDATTISYLGFSMIATSIGFLVWTQWKKNFLCYQTDKIIPTIFLLFGPGLLFFFASKWWSIIGQWSFWVAGNDWTTYQFFARKIVVEGEWLKAGESIFILQPFYRYLVGIYHLLFGQSAFVQHMADVWCVLGATIIIVAFAIKFRISPLIIFITSTIYLSLNLISAFRYHIGKGLVENHAMVFLMLAAWYIYRAREGGTSRIILGTLFGILGYWTRQDHLGAIAGIAFLALEPINEPTGSWKGYLERFKLQWKLFVCYWGAGIFSVLLICFRHWWLGGAFYPTIMKHPNLQLDNASAFPGSFYIVLTGQTWPAFPPTLGFIVTFGVLIALLALVWRPKSLLNFPLGLSITFVGLLAPYAFLITWGYPPRYSIHLLPLALLALGIFLSNILGRSKLPS
jgi:hypothetical protein